jgi:hypothetical protein
MLRQYVIQSGDSPASIAAQDSMAGCPRCGIELARVNRHKPSIVHPNGFVTFKTLAVGEIINLPDEWFHPARENLPPAYYRILPHADGVTPGSLGDALVDFPELDTAVSAVAQLAALDDAAFTRAVGDAGTKIDASVTEVYGSAQSPDAAAKARSVKDATHWAWLRNRDLAAAVAANDRATIAHARLDIQNSLSTALGNARLAMLAQSTSAAPSTFSSELQTAAKGAAAAIAADPNYCTSVTHPGNPVNAAVHRFKLAWNASQTPKVPIGTGTYEVATTVALAQVNGSAPSACGANQRPVPAPKPPPPLPQSKRDEDLDAPNLSSGWSVGKVIFGVAIAGAAAGGVAFLVTRPSKPSRGQPVTRREGFAT